MGAARPLIGAASLLLLAGGIVLQLFCILSGLGGSPLNLVYFLQVSTSNIDSASRDPVRWTFLALCGADDNGHNANCRATQAALPFDPPRNFGTEQGIPEEFIGTNKFYYLSRFMFAFYLIALFFAIVSLFVGVLALCTRLGSYLSGFTVSIALFFQTLTAALMTAWTVQGRNAFRSASSNASEEARLGRYAYGFTWGAMACFLICTVLFCIGGRAGKNETYQKKSYFGRKRSTRSRGSFIDGESQRRVKDEYE